MSTYYHEATIECLKLLGSADSMTARALAERMGVSKEVAKRKIGNLHTKGLIDSRRNSVPVYFITPKGQQILRKHTKQDDLGEITAPRTLGMSGTYDGAELRPFTGRAGAMDAYALPSLLFCAPSATRTAIS